MENWIIINNLSNIPSEYKGFGCCYVVKIPIIQGVFLIKIGATAMPKTRLELLKRAGTIFCVSPLHVNYWENEEILYNKYSKYRLPSRPHKDVQAVNISFIYFFQTLPNLMYKTN